MENHKLYMERCIELASMGLGSTYPNPLVGCVIVNDNKIIGEGWHQKSGNDHAEVVAINQVKDKTLLQKSTLYVNLEPCSFHGKTPPCSNLILNSGIKKVVIGSVDFNPDVNGDGVKFLKNNGIDVITNILPKKSFKINKRFFTFHKLKRPYIILKWAQSLDGYIAPNIEKYWISSNQSKQLVHKMRSQEQSILIGTKTAYKDNPKLTNRLWPGNNPIRIVIDRTLKLPNSLNVFNKDSKTIFLTENLKKNINNLYFGKINFDNFISSFFEFMYIKNIQSVIIEGGKYTLKKFIDSNNWDEAYVFRSHKLIKEGIKAPIINMLPKKMKKVSTDLLFKYKNDLFTY